MTSGRDPEYGTDKPLSACGIVRMPKIVADRSGVRHISAHDLRRIQLTLALENGTLLQDVPAQTGHANASTTLRYAQAADAKARRKRIAF